MPTLSALIPKTGYYRVKVIARQPQTEFRGLMSDGTIKIALKAVPEQGKANAELVSFLAKELGVKPGSLRISAGLTSPKKVIHIEFGQ